MAKKSEGNKKKAEQLRKQIQKLKSSLPELEDPQQKDNESPKAYLNRLEQRMNSRKENN